MEFIRCLYGVWSGAWHSWLQRGFCDNKFDMKTSTHEGACSRNTLPQHAPGSKLPRVYQRFHAKNMLRNKSFALWFCSLVLKPVHTKELAPETYFCNIFAPWFCSLISNQFNMREQKQGAKVLLRNTFFRVKSLVHTRELAPGACCGIIGRKREMY